MKIVVIGGSGLIGTKLASMLWAAGNELIDASRISGINTITGLGLAESLENAQVIIDVSNAPSFEDHAVMDFFETSGHNILAAAAAADVRHIVALSVVGTDRMDGSGYFRAKQAQEKLIRDSGIPYTIIRTTQFFEFLGAIADEATRGDAVRLSSALLQPLAADDVARVVADIADEHMPANGVIELGGPERGKLCDFVERLLAARRDPRRVVRDQDARYYGALLERDSLVPDQHLDTTATNFDAWLLAYPQSVR